MGYAAIDHNSETYCAYVSENNPPINENKLIQLANSLLRILGDRYRYYPTSSDYDQKSEWENVNKTNKSYFKSYIAKVAELNDVNVNVLHDYIYHLLVQLGHHGGLINFDKLFLHIAEKDDPVYICTNCGRPHMQESNLVCTFCHRNLVKSPKKSNDLRDLNYLIRPGEDTIFRLHSEELTGQTDDQLDRQRKFRDIFISEQNQREIQQVETIDLLSVTTTMEVGVDIGNLQGIMMGNMPPMRFNYQQRVGRAGRRGQAYSYALTLARQRPHDEYYFESPEILTNEIPPVPFLTVNQEHITRRLITKEILRRAFWDAGVRRKNSPATDTHGQFGCLEDWEKYKEMVMNWFEDEKRINDVVEVITNTSEVEIESREESYDSLLKFAKEDLINKITSVLEDERYAQEGIAETLAEGGILPMFGMPSRIRYLFHGKKDFQMQSIDRDQELAISEFAPGSQKTKDKGIYESIGFTPELDYRGGKIKEMSESPFSSVRYVSSCSNCGLFQMDNSVEERDFCKICGTSAMNGFLNMKVVSPNGYRTNLLAPKDASDDFRLRFGSSPSLVEKIEQDYLRVRKFKIHYNETGIVWKLNTNGGKGFRGALVQTKYSLEHQWISEDYINTVSEENQYQIENIGLFAQKVTGILRIRPAKIVPGINLDVFKPNPDAGSSVKGAIYSALFLIKKISSQILDIDSKEIEVSKLRRVPIDENNHVMEGILSDALENGSGFVEWISQRFDYVIKMLIGKRHPFSQKLMNRQHKDDCKSACYFCLKSYGNMNYHSLFDWRLGISYLRVLFDGEFEVGLDGNFGFDELLDWKNNVILNLENFKKRLPYFQYKSIELNNIPGLEISYEEKEKKYLLLIVHPLWDRNKPYGILAKAINDAGLKYAKIIKIDSFNLMKRPAWCYSEVIENIRGNDPFDNLI